MKRIALMVAISILSMLSIFCATKLDTVEQLVSGYIGRNVELTIGDFLYSTSNGGRGINLDINNDSNNIRYQISPTQVPCSKVGLLVGRFSLISSTSDITLTISHTKLNNGQNGNVDYELAVDYVVKNDGNTSDMYAYSTSTSPIVFDFSSGDGVIIIENAGIYFRLCTEVTTNGDYTSAVTFSLETKT